MKLWIIAAIVIGMLAITGVVFANITSVSADKEKETLQCANCENGCTSARNCGLATCAAVKGGSCGCGR